LASNADDPEIVPLDFAPTRTYLDTATYGLAPTAVAEVVIAAERARLEGRFRPTDVDEAVAASRARWGALVGAPAERVAVAAQVATAVGLVAAALPAGTTVLVPEGEFTSVLWPFLARAGEGIRTRTVRLAGLVEAAAAPDVGLVAASAVQSADGAVLDVAALVTAAHGHGARALVDVTQGAGWLPLADACAAADWVVGAGYKWLMAPRGTAFLAGTEEALDLLTPVHASWFAGQEPWESCYGGPLRLADDARRFDLSPAWPAWLGQRVALDLLAEVGVDAVHRHDVELANRLRVGLGLAPGDSAIVSLSVPDGTAERLAAADIAASVRAGRLRLSCHVHNTAADVDRALDVLVAARTAAA